MNQRLIFKYNFLWMVTLIYLAVLTQSPFDYSREWLPVNLNQMASFNFTLRDFLLNILLFLPVGMLVCGAGKSPWKKALGFGLIVTLVIECAQFFLNRNPSIFDVAANALGAGLGGYLISRPALIRPLISLTRKRLACMRLLALLVLTAVTGGLVLQPLTQNRLENWNTHFALIFGDEFTRDRPWKGRVVRFALYDKPISGKCLFQNKPGSPPLLAYDFTSETDTVQSSGEVRNVPLLSFHGGFQSILPVTAVYQRVIRSGAFTLELEFATADLHQGGPARLVTASDSPARRNFMIGQNDRDLYFRVRTPVAGRNGARINLVARNALTDTAQHHLVCVFNRGVQTLWLDGGRIGAFEPVMGHLSVMYQLGRSWLSRILVLYLIFLPWGFILRLLWHFRFALPIHLMFIGGIQAVYSFMGAPVYLHALLLELVFGLTGMGAAYFALHLFHHQKSGPPSLSAN